MRHVPVATGFIHHRDACFKPNLVGHAVRVYKKSTQKKHETERATKSKQKKRRKEEQTTDRTTNCSHQKNWGLSWFEREMHNMAVLLTKRTSHRFSITHKGTLNLCALLNL